MYYMFGDLPFESAHAKFILTQKYITVRPTNRPQPLFGYFNSNSNLQCLIPDILSNALLLWADPSVLRHMTIQHHLNLTGIIVLATTCCVVTDKKIKSCELISILISVYIICTVHIKIYFRFLFCFTIINVLACKMVRLCLNDKYLCYQLTRVR